MLLEFREEGRSSIKIHLFQIICFFQINVMGDPYAKKFLKFYFLIKHVEMHLKT